MNIVHIIIKFVMFNKIFDIVLSIIIVNIAKFIRMNDVIIGHGEGSTKWNWWFFFIMKFLLNIVLLK